MARLESIHFTSQRCNDVDGCAQWSAVPGALIEDLPQICWSTGVPWREANLWLMESATSREVDIATVQANARQLHAYAQWLEATGTDWWDFPPRKADRCLVKYRGALVASRDADELAPSTAASRMRVAVRFYRWLRASGLLSPQWPMWQERSVGVRLTDPVGFERTMMVTTTDLAIKNRSAPGDKLEDGVLPVTSLVRDKILAFAQEHASREVFLMLSFGFYTGMRLGTICDLKVQTLLNAVPDPSAPGLFRLAVGPGASPKVATKYGVTGHIWIPGLLLEQLHDYAHDLVRLKREALAKPEQGGTLFLTRFGNPYARRGSNKSVAFNVEMHRLRSIALDRGSRLLDGFRFHQTRATFGTQLARLAISKGGALNAIAIVKEALLHKHEATSLKYIKFVEKAPVKEALANEFTREFLGLLATVSPSRG